MPSITVLVYAYTNEQASLLAYNGAMQEIKGGCACRVVVPDGSYPPILLVLALSNIAAIKTACLRPGGAELILLAQIAAQPVHRTRARHDMPRKELPHG